MSKEFFSNHWQGVAIMAFFLVTLTMSLHVGAAENMDELLQLIRQGISTDAQIQKQRLEKFRTEIKSQDSMIASAEAEKRQLEAKSQNLEKQFAENEKELAKLQEQLISRMGNLKEMFGVVQQVAGDSKGVFRNSLISAKYPDRDKQLDTIIRKSGSNTEIPSIEDLETLWFELQQHLVQTGKIEKLSLLVTDIHGKDKMEEVMLVGPFNVISEDAYLVWNEESQSLTELQKQPPSYIRKSTNDIFNAAAGDEVAFWLDPSRGSLLSILLRAPKLDERIQQGGVVGYIIIALGVLALLIALERIVRLAQMGRKIQQQMSNSQALDDNPLGRVMRAYHEENSQGTDIEALELSVSEAIAKEVPDITRYISWLKIIAAIAPLLGLLGTVTGMINTFEVMSLFGTGDPKLMAGGISQALVTTVLGLAIAIPAVLLHTLTNERSKGIIHVLEERALGMLAQKAEARQAKV